MIDRLLGLINRVALVFAGLAILAMALLGGSDIVFTYIVNRPIDGVFEVTQMLMVMSIFLGLGAVHLNRSHICVDIGYDLMPSWAKRASEMLTLLIMLGFFGALTWRAWGNAVHSWQIGEYTSGIVAFPLYPAKFALAIGSTIVVLFCLVDLLRGGRFRKSASFADRAKGDLAAS